MKVLLIVYDNKDTIGTFPLGLGYIASVARAAGHEIEVYDQNILHSTVEELTSHIDKNGYDVVGTGMCAGYHQYKELLRISQSVNNASPKPFYIIGGPIVTPEPEYFLELTQADAIVMGEGEDIIVDLLDNIDNLEGVGDVAWRGGVNPRRSIIKDIDSIPFPAYDLFDVKHYRVQRRQRMLPEQFSFPIMTGRGCPFSCNFCYQMEDSFRKRSNDSIFKEMEYLMSEYNITHFFFADDLLMSSKKRIVSFCEELIDKKWDIVWDCSGRLNYATDEVLDLMAKAGCVFVNYGIESFNDDMLKVMGKNLDTKRIEEGIKSTLKAGVSPGINIIWGNIGETEKHLWNSVEFVCKYSDAAQKRTVKPVTPYPGTPLYKYAVENGMIGGAKDFYENRHINSDLLAVNFTDIPDDKFYKTLAMANDVLIKDYYNKVCKSDISIMNRLYFEGDLSFRGFRRA